MHAYIPIYRHLLSISGMIKKYASTLLSSLSAIVMAFAISGCGGGDDAPVNNSPGPAVFSAFNGVTIEVNPTLRFLGNAQIHYTNTQTSSAFPTAATAINGTYTYTPASDFLSGTLRITLPTLNQTLSMTFGSFVRQGNAITSFTTVYNGQSYTSNVTAGTLTAASVAGGTTTTGGSTPSTNTPTLGQGETTASAIPSSLQGTHALTFSFAQNNSPVADGTQTTFVIGANTLQVGTKTLSNPIFYNTNQNEWIFKDGNLWYAISKTSAGALNEINLSGPKATPFYGQYNSTPSNTGGGSGSGGSTTTSGGNLAAGTTFTRTVKTAIVAPAGSTIPAGVPSYSVGTQVTFTINSSGEITFSGLAVPYGSDGGSALLYNQVISAGNSNSAQVFKNLTTGAPTGVSLSFTRTSLSLPPSIKMISYTLD